MVRGMPSPQREQGERPAIGCTLALSIPSRIPAGKRSPYSNLGCRAAIDPQHFSYCVISKTTPA